MTISVFDMFSIGIGPSSSHTVGPMRAALQFIDKLTIANNIDLVAKVKVELFGSLGHTGIGHGTDVAVILGLMGEKPEEIDPDTVQNKLAEIASTNMLHFAGQKKLSFSRTKDIVLHKKRTLPAHPNGMTFTAFDTMAEVLLSYSCYSIGGGFVVDEEKIDQKEPITEEVKLPYPFSSGEELLNQCKKSGLSISALMLANETAWRTENETRDYLRLVWKTMDSCIERGCHTEGILPGGLNVKRRAAHIYRKLNLEEQESQDPLKVMDWVNLYALAVNEENAAGGKVVTAPTNGAAGIIPAVLKYFLEFKGKNDEAVIRFLLTAAAIGILFKKNASISGAEVGCQGEVGVACSMASAGLAEILGGTVEQCEDAAEIGMEHNLGLTCDPVGGLVQIPCIERNAMAAVTAINSARLALHGDGSHKVSLDEVIATMRETGRDMKMKYKETAKGGLAVNIIEC